MSFPIKVNCIILASLHGIESMKRSLSSLIFEFYRYVGSVRSSLVVLHLIARVCVCWYLAGTSFRQIADVTMSYPRGNVKFQCEINSESIISWEWKFSTSLAFIFLPARVFEICFFLLISFARLRLSLECLQLIKNDSRVCVRYDSQSIIFVVTVHQW